MDYNTYTEEEANYYEEGDGEEEGEGEGAEDDHYEQDEVVYRKDGGKSVNVDVWDDSVLIEAWDAAVKEYQTYHSPKAKKTTSQGKQPSKTGTSLQNQKAKLGASGTKDRNPTIQEKEVTDASGSAAETVPAAATGTLSATDNENERKPSFKKAEKSPFSNRPLPAAREQPQAHGSPAQQKQKGTGAKASLLRLLLEAPSWLINTPKLYPPPSADVSSTYNGFAASPYAGYYQPYAQGSSARHYSPYYPPVPTAQGMEDVQQEGYGEGVAGPSQQQQQQYAWRPGSYGAYLPPPPPPPYLPFSQAGMGKVSQEWKAKFEHIYFVLRWICFGEIGSWRSESVYRDTYAAAAASTHAWSTRYIGSK
ncbi:hypothetical protein BC937DRAFT_88769 [Endogone sp. FLAS-F59071]|nr:hypothetical protein BC937DRAFT_88769 [Endogone sp. FLAS-F59071]|eukprot:RUS18446.1 hypothetical protein BC937DRAFT_88769 [Endogone sp. FLAS-F59071]